MMNPRVQMQPQIILLRDGTDTSQGKGQLISNINACQAIVETVRTTLGPRGMDKLIHSDRGVCATQVIFTPVAYLLTSYMCSSLQRLVYTTCENVPYRR